MEKVDILIQALSPEIEVKCVEIHQKKSEQLLTRVFAAMAVLMLILPVLLIFLGISFAAIMLPILLVGAVCLIASPILFSKGDKCYE